LAAFKFRLQKQVHNNLKKQFTRTHLLIFTLQLLFAFYAVGNAEFMVMLPLLLLLILAGWVHLSTRSLYLAGAAFFTWNLAYGILPNHLFKYTNYEPL